MDGEEKLEAIYFGGKFTSLVAQKDICVQGVHGGQVKGGQACTNLPMFCFTLIFWYEVGNEEEKRICKTNTRTQSYTATRIEESLQKFESSGCVNNDSHELEQ